MKLTFTADSTGAVAAIDVPEEGIETLLAILEAEFGIPSSSIIMVHNGRALQLSPSSSLASVGVADGDMVIVADARNVRTGAGAGAASRPSAAGAGAHGARGSKKRTLTAKPAPNIPTEMYTSLTWDTLPPGTSYEQMHAILQVNKPMMALLERRDPKLAAAAKEATPAAFKSIQLQRHLDALMPEATRQAKLAQLERRLLDNPYDVEAQQLLEEEIRRKNVEENMELAYEHMPESFGKVHMLYIDAAVNRTLVKAFVDSGAQSTIMSKKCAERCGIMRLVDTKFAGTAVGVGSAKIIGRVHMAELKIGDNLFPCTFTVLDQDDMDFLLGLDMLKRYQACIDLYRNVLRLRLGGEESEVPFLSEGQLPGTAFGNHKSFEELPEDSEGHDSAHGAGAGSGSASSSSAAVSAAAGAGAGSTSGTGTGTGSGATDKDGDETMSGSGSSNRHGGNGSSGSCAASAAGAGASSSSSSASSSTAPSTTAASSSSSRPPTTGSGTPSGAAAAAGPAPAPGRGGPGAGSTTMMFDLSQFGIPATAGAGGGGGRSGGGGASAAAAASSSSAAQAGAGATAPLDETAVQLLMSMGFPRGKVVQALAMAGGDAELAAGLLPDL